MQFPRVAVRDLNSLELMKFLALSGHELLRLGVVIVASYLLALPVGWERKRHSQAYVGLRVFPLVAVGACAYVFVAQQLFTGEHEREQAQGLQGLMTGIGFIGAGAIIKHGRDVRGVATAASMWTTGAIGVAVAAGPGLRTVPLVSVGACGYVLISRFLYEQGVYDMDGMVRALRSVITGIGFIGGGAIVKETRDVRGLATAAAIWISGAIGAAIAFGHYEVGAVVGLSTVFMLAIQRRLARHVRRTER